MAQTILYCGKSKDRENAVAMAAALFGRAIESGRDIYAFYTGSQPAQYARFEWVREPETIACEGLPTITLPSNFRFISVPNPYSKR